ncbi:MAG: glycoside hydrolase family 25 protein, partial [Bacteroidia bacterium]
DFQSSVRILPIEETAVARVNETLQGKPAKYEIHGLDVARYQKQINWPVVKKTGVEFVFIKATEGIGLKDSFFDVNWQQAKEVGVRRGAYHFYIAEKDPALQAANFIYNTQMEPGDLPPVLDVEVTRGMSGKVIREGVQVWLDMVEKAYDKRPIIYTGYHFYRNYLQGHFNDYPLWIAHYNGYEKTKLDREWLFWQHTDRGKLAGIKKEVDLNVFRGNIADLDSMCIPAKPAVNFVLR